MNSDGLAVSYVGSPPNRLIVICRRPGKSPTGDAKTAAVVVSGRAADGDPRHQARSSAVLAGGDTVVCRLNARPNANSDRYPTLCAISARLELESSESSAARY